MTLVCDAVRAAPRKVRVSRVLAPIGPGKGLEQAILREARKALRELRRVVNESLIPEAKAARAELKAGAPSPVGDGIGEWARRAWRRISEFLFGAAEKMVRQALSVDEARHQKSFVQAVNKAIGVDLAAVVTSQDVAPNIELAMQRSVGLIRNLTDEVAAQIEKALFQAITEGWSTARMAEMLTERFGIADRRARFIARDQAATFNGELNRIRMQQAGVTEYVWSTSLDERVRGRPDGRYPKARPSHWAREGQVFSWTKPPEGGHPGMGINCRCVARAVLGDPRPMQEQARARQKAALERMTKAKAAKARK